MKTYKIVKYSNMWSTKKLTRRAELIVNDWIREGWELVSISFGFNHWYIPTAFITLSKNQDFV